MNRFGKVMPKRTNRCHPPYTGTHTLRHNYALSSYLEHQSDGMTDLQARSSVADELFHHCICVIYNYIPAVWRDTRSKTCRSETNNNQVPIPLA